MKKYYLLCIFFALFFLQSSLAQIDFTNRNDLLPNPNFHSGVAIAIVDMNGDGKDDIARMDQGYQLNVEFQTDPNSTFTNMYVGELNFSSNWSMCAADVDNNGFVDVMADGELAMANVDGTSFTISEMPETGFFIQATNFVDINNDGHLDAFLCNDNGESGILGNDGFGNLVPQNDWIDMSVDGDSGEPASGNYGSIWTDFDNDGDIDLYIAKCRQGVTDSLDLRRINVLYVNDGNGNYTEMGETYGLRIGWQTWTADFQDINNDGWLDVFMTNHDHEAQIFLNDGTGHYSEVMNTGITQTGLPIQGVMRDFDNDGFVDVLIAGYEGQIFRNNGDLTFTPVTGIFDANAMESFALGDLNSDGFVDIYGGYANIYTNPSNIDDVIWMNNGNSNNHLSVNLEGVISNKDAVGARIEIYGDWGIQVREVRAGESYGIMNSMTQYFGLGTAPAVDSLIVRWPSGVIQTEYDININSQVQLLEGGCLAAAPSINVSGATVFCTGDSVVLSATAGYDTYSWSSGETTPSLTVFQQGNYKVTVTDANGCFAFSESIIVTVDPVWTPEIVEDNELLFCAGGSVNLSEVNIPNGLSYTWSNGANGNVATITQAGTYNVVVEGPCENFTSNSITVDVINFPNSPSATGASIALNETATLNATGNNLEWYEVATGGNPIAFGPQYITPPLTANTTYYVDDRNGIAGLNESVGEEEHLGTDYAANPDANNFLYFQAFEEFTLDSVTVYTDLPGIRIIILFDQNFNQIQSKEVDLVEGKSTIHLGFEVPIGTNMAITTDWNTNFTNTGSFGPRLKRSDENVNFPYAIDNVVSINGTDFGTTWYYYFYDWKISTPSTLCVSDRTPVDVLVDQVATIDISQTDDLQIFPNPTSGDLSIEIKFEIQDKINIELSDMTGKRVFEKTIQDKITHENLDFLPKGIYTLQIKHDGDVYVGKVVRL